MTRFLLLFILFSNVLFSQQNLDISMAEFNYDNRNYQEAIKLYSKSIYKIPYSRHNYINFSDCYRNLYQYDKALDILEKGYKLYKDDFLLMSIAFLYLEQKKNEKANTYFEQLIYNQSKKRYIDNDKIKILEKLIEYQQFDHALKIIDDFEKSSESDIISMMRGDIYSQQGDMEKVIDFYVGLIINNREKNDYLVKRKIYRLLFYNQTNKDIILPILRQKAIQNEDKLAYLDVLCWLYNIEGNYEETFNFCRSLYLRKYWNYYDFYSYGLNSFNARKYSVSEKVFYILDNEEEKNPTYEFMVKKYLLKSNFYNLENNENPKFLEEIDMKYKKVIDVYKIGNNTVDIIIDYAYFLSYSLNKKDDALEYLDNIVKLKTTPTTKAKSHMAKGDIYNFYGNYTKAILEYARAEKLGKRTELEEEAKFKSAKTSYYSGDFKWAKHQLNVFKKNTTRLTSNDAIELSFLIHQNIPDESQDSLKIPLTIYAKSDLLRENKNFKSALVELDYLIENYPDNSIIDEAMFMKATINENIENPEIAEKLYIEILEKYPHEPISETVLYKLALFYVKNKNDQKAKEYLEKIMFEKQGSVYMTEARVIYKKLIDTTDKDITF